ncbi:GIY-YIG nuclease family protein, partial [Corallococcus exercitus]
TSRTSGTCASVADGCCMGSLPPSPPVSSTAGGLRDLPNYSCRSKEFWQEAIVFTSKDENLTKSHIRYLESRLLELARTAKRYEVKNGNQPAPAGLPRPDRDAMEEFLGHLRLLLGALGHRLLEPLIETAALAANSASDAATLTYTIKSAVARARITDEGLVVLQGSTALAQVNVSMGAYRVLREALVESRQLVPEGDLLHFKENVLFSSASAAANVISGNAVNGRTAWRDAKGRTLKEIEEAKSTG